ncbi:MAG: NADH-quinone oxidoreductase subunit NuoE [Lautropia sp.]
MSVSSRARPAQPLLSADGYQRIDREIAKYPAEQKQSAVMAALAIAQDEIGWVSPAVIDDIARVLGMPPIAVYEVATFYNMYNQEPVGQFKIGVCTCLPCALRDGAKAGEYLKDKLGIDYGETTADGRFTLIETECLGACGDAPVCLVNNKRMESFMDNARLDALLAELGSAAASPVSGAMPVGATPAGAAGATDRGTN